MDSDIFALKTENNEIPNQKRSRARVISADDRFNPYRNNQSSIVF